MPQRSLKLQSALFCGVESFDAESLASFDKRQNITDQVDLIRRCLDAGILFLYGIIADPTRRTIRSLQAELEFILENYEITLPSYITLPIPLMGTPLFFGCLKAGTILPRTRVRDLDGTTLSLRPLEELETFSAFWPRVLRWSDYKHRLIARTYRFLKRYRHALDWSGYAASIGNTGVQLLPKYRNRKRTFISTTECLDPVYEPAFPVSSKFRSYFEPLYLTDEAGRLNSQFEELLNIKPAKQATA